ncbi:MAG UNVERIFIED_CONTAM: hypothetical protein LVT10_00680 [Anaerolineae bacterium]
MPASDFQRLEADGLILLGERPFWRDELAQTDYPAPVLTRATTRCARTHPAPSQPVST